MASEIVQSVAASAATDCIIHAQGCDFVDQNADFWYVVLVGRKPGVHFKGHDIVANLSHIPGASVIKCHTEDEALAEFACAVHNGTAEKVTLTESSTHLNISALASLPMGIIPDYRTPSSQWYAVTIGRFPGVYNRPSGLAANTCDISGAAPKKFKSKIAAVEHFTAALTAGLVVQHTYNIERVTL